MKDEASFPGMGNRAWDPAIVKRNASKVPPAGFPADCLWRGVRGVSVSNIDFHRAHVGKVTHWPAAVVA